MIPIKQTVSKDHRLNRKEWRAVSKLAWEDAGATWHRQLLPKHFEVGAYREYGYAPRGRAYDKRKQQKMGHRRPMVWKGNLRRAVLRQRNVSTTGNTSKRQGAAKIRLTGPSYLRVEGRHHRAGATQRGSFGRGTANFAAELQAISNRDGQILARRMDKLLTAELDKAGPKVRQGHR